MDIKRADIWYGIDFRFNPNAPLTLNQVEQLLTKYKLTLDGLQGKNLPSPVPPQTITDFQKLQTEVVGTQAKYRVLGGNAQETANHLRTLANRALELAPALEQDAKGFIRFNQLASQASSAADRLEGKMGRLSFAYQVQQGMVGRLSGVFSQFGIAGDVVGDGLNIAAGGLTTITPLLLGATVAGAGLLATFVDLGRRGIPELAKLQEAEDVLLLSGERFDEIRKKVLALRADLGEAGKVFSQAQLLEGIGELIKAGRSAGESLDILRASAKLAFVANADLNEMSQLVSTNLVQYKLPASEAARVSEALAKGALEAKGGIQGLSEGLKIIGPFADLLHFDLEESIAALVKLDKAGQDYNDYGATALRSALAQVADLTDKGKTAVEQLDVSLTNADGTARTAEEIFKDLIVALEGNANAGELIGKIFDTRAAPAVAVLAGGFQDLQNKMADSGDVLDKWANEKANNLDTASKRLQTTLNDLGLTFVEGLNPYITASITALNDFLTMVNNVVRALAGLNQTRIETIDKQIADIEAKLEGTTPLVSPSAARGYAASGLSSDEYTEQLRDQLEKLKAERKAINDAIKLTPIEELFPGGLPGTTPPAPPATPTPDTKGNTGTGSSVKTNAELAAEALEKYAKTLDDLVLGRSQGAFSSEEEILQTKLSTP